MTQRWGIQGPGGGGAGLRIIKSSGCVTFKAYGRQPTEVVWTPGHLNLELRTEVWDKKTSSTGQQNNEK